MNEDSVPQKQLKVSTPKQPSQAFVDFLRFHDQVNNQKIPNSKLDLEELQSKDLFLDSVATQLKSEFIGLDSQIDKIINGLRPWYLIPKSLNKPTILSLWGMTGVGKTSLVYELVKKLNLESAFFKFDLGKATDFQSTMNSYLSYVANRQSLLFFDEVQTARTIDTLGQDIDRPLLRDFWNLLDTGKISISLSEIIRIRSDIKNRYEHYLLHPTNPEFLLSDYEFYSLSAILRLNNDFYSLFKNSLKEDTDHLINWVIQEIEKSVYKTVYEDHTKALIILAGNIDEAYSDLMNVDPDQYTADELKLNLNTITPTQIKNGLLKRFRAEQVARMGTSLILFPTPSESSYHDIIKQKLIKISDKIKEDFNFEIKFETSVQDLIYKKGTIPAQGVRPILSTISELIESRLPKWIVECAKNDFLEYEIRFDDRTKCISLSHKEKVIITDTLLPEDENTNVNIPDKKFIEYLAVHEAAHLVVGISLMGMLPQRVIFKEGFSGTVPPQVRFKPLRILTAAITMDLAAINLAGYIAEIKKYGKEGLSSGARLDLKTATSLVSQMIMEMGMGNHIGVTLPHPDLVHNIKSMQASDDEAKESLLNKAYVLAETELKNQSLFYEIIVNELKTQHCLNHERLVELFNKYYIASDTDKEKILNRTNHKSLD